MSAARHYNQKSHGFEIRKGRWCSPAGRSAMDGDEREEPERARRKAASHAKDHDPEEQRNYRKYDLQGPVRRLP